MIRADNPQAALAGHAVPAVSMPERKVCWTKVKATAGGVMRQPAQRQNRVEMRHCLDLGLQERPATIDLGSDRLVVGGQATNSVGDPDITQHDVVITIRMIVASGESVPAQHLKQIAAGGIAGEGAPCPVGALATRCQTDDQQARPKIAKRGDRGVMPVGVACPAAVTKRDKPRTGLAVCVRLCRISQDALLVGCLCGFGVLPWRTGDHITDGFHLDKLISHAAQGVSRHRW